LNSNNRVDFIFLSNLFDSLQISEGLNYLNLNQINTGENKKKGIVPFGPHLASPANTSWQPTT
jgi:hypothetical protein